MKKSNHKKIKAGIRRRTIFLLIVATITNAFAWFIYSNKVSNTINAGVKSWKITFAQDGTNLENEVTFNINSIYPGMPNYTDRIEIRNSGEMAANITYELISVKIFEQTFTNATYTSAQLESILSDNYPFVTTFNVSSATIDINQSANFSVLVNWPYESGDDELDTFWGKKSYDFKSQNPGVNEIEIKVKIVASQ